MKKQYADALEREKEALDAKLKKEADLREKQQKEQEDRFA